jgi:hypothetical protein
MGKVIYSAKYEVMVTAELEGNRLTYTVNVEGEKPERAGEEGFIELGFQKHFDHLEKHSADAIREGLYTLYHEAGHATGDLPKDVHSRQKRAALKWLRAARDKAARRRLGHGKKGRPRLSETAEHRDFMPRLYDAMHRAAAEGRLVKKIVAAEMCPGPGNQEKALDHRLPDGVTWSDLKAEVIKNMK